MKKRTLAAVFGITTLLCDCSALQQSDLVGKYQDNNPFETSTLTLRADGTCSQVLTTKAGKSYTASSKWAFDSSENELRIDDALSYSDFGNFPFPGQPRVERITASYAVEKIIPDGQPQIVVDPDRGVAFAKVD